MNRPVPGTAARATGTAAVIIAFLVLTVSGCSGIRNDYPEKTTFRLTPPALSAVRGSGSDGDALPLLVKQLSISPEFESDAFVYRTGKNRFRSDFYHSFLIPPARMISDLVKETLYASGQFTPAISNAPADVRYQLWGKIIDLYADLRGEPPFKAVISMRLILDTDSGTGFTPVIHKIYNQDIAFNALDPDLYIDSLNKGLALILEDFFADTKEGIK